MMYLTHSDMSSIMDNFPSEVPPLRAHMLAQFSHCLTH